MTEDTVGGVASLVCDTITNTILSQRKYENLMSNVRKVYTEHGPQLGTVSTTSIPYRRYTQTE